MEKIEDDNHLNLFVYSDEEPESSGVESDTESVTASDTDSDTESDAQLNIAAITPSFYLDCLAGLTVAVGGGLCWAAMATLIHPFFMTVGLGLSGIGALGYIINHGLFTTLSSAASSWISKSEDGYESDDANLEFTG